jgi:hypothetical protein
MANIIADLILLAGLAGFILYFDDPDDPQRGSMSGR